MIRHMMCGAIAAIAIAAASCGGGDPGSNGETDGGVDPNDGVNLIEAIPGRWRVALINGQPPVFPYEHDVDVDPSDPSCERALSEVYPPPDSVTADGPPGDACISILPFSPGLLILDGPEIRIDMRFQVGPDDPPGIRHMRAIDGRVLDHGTRMVYTYEVCQSSAPACSEDSFYDTYPLELEKIP